MEAASAVEIRPAWPDELWRLKHYLPAAYLYEENPSFYVAVRGRVERLVAAAALSVNPLRSPEADLLFLRAEQLPERIELMDALVRRALDAAWEAGARSVRFGQTIDTDSPDAGMLRRAGFVEDEIHELYETPADTAWRGLDHIYRRLRDRHLIPMGAELTTLLPSVIGEARSFLLQHLPRSFSTLALESAGFKPEHSLALWLDGELKGILLCRRTGNTSHTGLRLVAPELRGGVAWANLLLVHASAKVAVQSGVVCIRFELNPALHEDTRQLAAILKARLVSRPALFRMDAPKSRS